MRCPQCGNLEDKVIDSREAKDGGSVRRRRECITCSHRFTTYEQVEHEELRVIKRNESRQPFSREKLINSLKIACGKRPISIDTLENAADAIIADINSQGFREIPTQMLGVKAMQQLERIDHIAFVRYASIYREFKDVGEFIEEIHSLGTRVPKDAKQPDLFP